MQGAFNDLIAVTGLPYAGFYILTALAAIVYYRREHERRVQQELSALRA